MTTAMRHRILACALALNAGAWSPSAVAAQEQFAAHWRGYWTQAGDTLFAPLRREVRKRAFKPAVDACEIVPGILSAAGVVGAVAAYKQQD